MKLQHLFLIALIWVNFALWSTDTSKLDMIYNQYKKKYDKAEGTFKNQTRSRRSMAEAEFDGVLTNEDLLYPFAPTTDEDTYLRSTYFVSVTQAKKDDNDYSNMTGIFATEEGRAMYYYYINPPENYTVEIPNPDYEMIIKMFINPWNERNSDMCCDATNEGACDDFPEFESGEDMTVSWFTNSYILHWSTIFKNHGEWGTYIEIHRPTDSRTIESVEITKMYRSGFSTEFISTKNLCAGRYELWFVLRTRNGRTIQYVKPFYSQEPSCTDEQIAESAMRRR